MKNVLILLTGYDSNSSYTASWAQALFNDLVKQNNMICSLFDAQYLCSPGNVLKDAVERSEFVVFYGHGTRDSWIAMPELSSANPPIPAIPLVDTALVGVLQGRQVYASCCWSLNGLGGSYIAQFPNAEYVGYSQEFGFEAANESYFKEVVNQSVIDFINGDSAVKVASNLRTEWDVLRGRFISGNLKTKRNAAMAASVADLNRQRIGSRP